MKTTISEMTNDILARDDDSPLDIFGHPPEGQMPLWASAEAAEALEWMMTLQDVPPRYAGDDKARKGQEFSPADAMDWRFPNAPHADPAARAWWDRVKDELFTHGLISESGWWRYRPTRTGRAYVKALCPPCEIRKVC